MVLLNWFKYNFKEFNLFFLSNINVSLEIIEIQESDQISKFNNFYIFQIIQFFYGNFFLGLEVFIRFLEFNDIKMVKKF